MSSVLLAEKENLASSPSGPARSGWVRWSPFAFSIAAMAVILLASGTPILDLLRYAAYAVLAVVLPGTLVYRALRRRAHTFVEDVAMGAAVGLVLELGGWVIFSALDLRGVIWLWPLLVIIPFVAVPRLRRHWLVRDYASVVPLGWAWTLAAIVVFFAGYLYAVFFSINPIMPDTESTRQFLDLPYQLSLAGEAKHSMPVDYPQVAGEPLHYHWFAFVHIAMSSMVGHIELPVLTMRLMVLAICALTAVLTAVVGWRLSGRKWVGIGAAAMFFVIGEFDFAAAGWPPFATQTTFVIWPSLSMTYSWALLVALIGVAGDLLRTRSDDNPVPGIGRGAWVLVLLLALASSAAKGSSLPVMLGALAFAGLLVLVTRRRIAWTIVGLGAAVAVSQLAATALVFHFQTYGVQVTPLSNIDYMWSQANGPRGPVKQAAVVGAVWLAYLLHLQLRATGIIAMLWERKGRLDQVQWFLLGGAIVGPALHLLLSGYAASWFLRAGFPFSLFLSAWGYALLWERANLSRRGKVALVVGTGAFALVLTGVTWVYGVSAYPAGQTYSTVLPMLKLAAVLGGLGLLAAIGWRVLRTRMPQLKGRGALVALTAALVAGAPGLVMDAKQSWGVQGGPYEVTTVVPAARVEAARWVREHSEPAEVVATNMHCQKAELTCPVAESFWLSAYTERSILIEGWAFAPWVQAHPSDKFWNTDLYQLNEDAFYAPTAAKVNQLRTEHGVRYLVVVRDVAPESPALAGLAKRVFDNGKVAVYELAG